MMPSIQELPTAFVVRSGSFFIGTQPQCHLRLSCPGVDELHCAVVGRQGRFFLRNFARTAGVRLNGRCVFGEMELRDQDGIDVGAARLAFLQASAEPQGQVRLVTENVAAMVAVALPLAPRRTRVTQIVHKSALVQPPLPVVPASPEPPKVRKTRVTQLGLAAPPPLEHEPITAVPSGSPVRKTRVTQVLRKSDLAALETPAETPAPAPAVPEIRKTRVTQVLRKSDLASLETPAAALATAPAIPEVRKTRVTILRKADIASQEAEPLLAPPAMAPVETPNEEEAAALLLTESEAEAAPADSSTAEPAAPLAGIKGVPAYALAMGGKPGEEKRPMLRLIVGRKDRVQPLLRKWELEGAQIAAQHRPSRVPSLVMSSRWLVAGMAVLLVLGLAGGYFIGRPRYWRAANANPIAITIDQWDRLSDAEQNDPDNISAVSTHIRAGAAADRPPAEPKEPGPAKSSGSGDPNI